MLRLLRVHIVYNWIYNVCTFNKNMSESLASSDLPVLKVLLVDDQPFNLQIAQRVVAKTSALVQTAEGGLAAIELARKTSFDLILMDIQMPDLDGFTASKEIRSFDAKVQIYIMSGDVPTEEILNSEAVNGYIMKPLRPQALLSLLTDISSK